MKKAIFLFLLLFLSFFFFLWQSLPLPSFQEKIFLVKKGEGAFQIAKNLKKEGILRSEFPFLAYLIFKGKEKKLKAGYYLLSPSMKFYEIAEKLTKGDVILKKITIIEGKNKKEIAKYLEKEGICKKEEFLEKIKLKYWKEKFDFLKGVEAEDLEGFLFPDTYFIKMEDKVEVLILKMLKNFEKKFKKEWREKIEKEGKSIYDILILASLLEKEVKNFQEKKIVSGILWKRLENDIPLQVDATITFITGKKTTKISLEETKIDSPYNTYKYKGLPPTPICNPGLESIEAAIFPQETDYWYYLSTPEGKTIFQKTFKEHLLAKEKYLR